MELVKTVGENKIYKKRSGRYGVKNGSGKWINGDDKINVLLSEGLIKASAPKPKEEPVQEEAADAEPVEEAAEETASEE